MRFGVHPSSRAIRDVHGLRTRESWNPGFECHPKVSSVGRPLSRSTLRERQFYFVASNLKGWTHSKLLTSWKKSCIMNWSN